jgi:hypothetical protein
VGGNTAEEHAVWSLNRLDRFISTYEPRVSLVILVSPKVDLKLQCVDVDGRKPKARQEVIIWIMQVLAVELRTKLEDSTCLEKNIKLQGDE